MSKEQKSDTTKDTTRSSAKGTPLTAIEDRLEQEQKQGFRGTEVDPTPNENYTVAGVTSGAPTPETDVDSANTARQATGLGMGKLEAADKEKAERGEK